MIIARIKFRRTWSKTKTIYVENVKWLLRFCVEKKEMACTYKLQLDMEETKWGYELGVGCFHISAMSCHLF